VEEIVRKGVWDQIVRLDKAIEKLNLSFDNLLVKRIGNGEGMRFWANAWCDKEPLFEASPSGGARYE